MRFYIYMKLLLKKSNITDRTLNKDKSIPRVGKSK